MEVTLKRVEELSEALDLAPLIDSYAHDRMAEFRDDAPPADIGKSLLERCFEAPECVVVVALHKETGERLGLCVTAPFVDPLLDETTPFVVVLAVERNWRHRGLARHLVDRATSELEARGFERLAARAGHNDDALISMGERWGFIRQWEWMVRE